MKRQFEKEAVDKIVEFFKEKYKIKVIKQRVCLWNSKLKVQLPNTPLQPDIDILAYNTITKELIGVEVKIIYTTEEGKINWKYYDGIGQTLALHMFGLDKVYFLHLFLMSSQSEENISEMMNCFNIYLQNIKDIVRGSDLSIGYLPCYDLLWENKLIKNPIKVFYNKITSKTLLIEPKRNPILNLKLEHVEKIREFLMNKYVRPKFE